MHPCPALEGGVTEILQQSPPLKHRRVSASWPFQAEPQQHSYPRSQSHQLHPSLLQFQQVSSQPYPRLHARPVLHTLPEGAIASTATPDNSDDEATVVVARPYRSRAAGALDTVVVARTRPAPHNEVCEIRHSHRFDSVADLRHICLASCPQQHSLSSPLAFPSAVRFLKVVMIR